MKRAPKIAGIFVALALAGMLFVCPWSNALEPAFGDAGSYSGSSSYGGGSSSSGSSSWSSSGSSSSGSYYYGDYDDDDSMGGIVIAIIVIVVIAFVIFGPKKKGGDSGGDVPNAGGQWTDESKLESLDKLREADPSFDEADVEEFISNVYVKMQNAWTAKDYEPVRPYLDGNLYAQHARQLDQMKLQHRTNYINNIAVLEVTLSGWYNAGDEDCLVAKVRTRINDYVVDDDSGNCVQGSPDRELFMTYEYTLSRPAGSKTDSADAIHAHECPNCGAPLDEGSSAKCPYCGSVINVREHDWVISKIKGISQQNA